MRQSSPERAAGIRALCIILATGETLHAGRITGIEISAQAALAMALVTVGFFSIRT